MSKNILPELDFGTHNVQTCVYNNPVCFVEHYSTVVNKLGYTVIYKDVIYNPDNKYIVHFSVVCINLTKNILYIRGTLNGEPFVELHRLKSHCR